MGAVGKSSTRSGGGAAMDERIEQDITGIATRLRDEGESARNGEPEAEADFGLEFHDELAVDVEANQAPALDAAPMADEPSAGPLSDEELSLAIGRATTASTLATGRARNRRGEYRHPVADR